MSKIIVGMISLLLFTNIGAFANKATSSDIEKYPSLVIDFTKGSSDLSDDVKKDVRNFITRARANEKINEVYVAAWADHPRIGEKSLSDGEQELARQRARNLREFLEDQLKVDVDTFNMAKRTDFWGRIFNTEEARVKGQKPAGHDRVAWLIHEDGKPSSAVLVVEPDKSSLSE